jgi:hypothetical protein
MSPLVLSLLIAVNVEMGVTDYQKVAQGLPWTWSDEKAFLSYSLSRRPHGYMLETTETRVVDRVILSVRKSKMLQLTFEAHVATVFTWSGDTLYLTDFSYRSSGCAVVAFDLKTGRQVWKQQLKGRGPFPLVKSYRNEVNIETDGKAVTIWGNESAGRYVEILDAKTGKMVGHKVFGDK